MTEVFPTHDAEAAHQPVTTVAGVERAEYQVGPEALEELLQPDTILATRVLDRSIQAAEADPNADPEERDLLRFQRSLIDMDPVTADIAAGDFATSKGRYADFAHTFGKSRPNIHHPINRGLIIPDLASEERWRIVGIDPSRYGDDAYGNAYRRAVENSWRAAITARQTLAEAQAAEAQAMELVTHPEAFRPRATV